MDQYDQTIYKKNEYFENNYFSVQELKKLRLAKKGKKGAKEAKGLDKKSGGAKSIEVMKLEQDEEADFNMEGEEEEEEVAGQLSSRGDVSARGGSSQLGHRQAEDCPHDKTLTFQGMLGKEGLPPANKKHLHTNS